MATAFGQPVVAINNVEGMRQAANGKRHKQHAHDGVGQQLCIDPFQPHPRNTDPKQPAEQPGGANGEEQAIPHTHTLREVFRNPPGQRATAPQHNQAGRYRHRIAQIESLRHHGGNQPASRHPKKRC